MWAILHFCSLVGATRHEAYLRGRNGGWKLVAHNMVGESGMLPGGFAYHVVGEYTAKGACVSDFVSVLLDPLKSKENQYHFIITGVGPAV